MVNEPGIWILNSFIPNESSTFSMITESLLMKVYSTVTEECSLRNEGVEMGMIFVILANNEIQLLSTMKDSRVMKPNNEDCSLAWTVISWRAIMTTMKPYIENNGTISLTIKITFEIPGHWQSLTMRPNPTFWIRPQNELVLMVHSYSGYTQVY